MKRKLHISISFSKVVYFMCYFLTIIFVFSTSNAQVIEGDSLDLNSNLMSKNKINELVIGFAKDSINYDIMNNKVFLFNNAEIKYENITLKAAYIELDSDKNIVFAKSLINDSIGENYGYPVFSEDGKSFTSKEITYNFNTKKGIIKDVRTQEGESFILGNKVKKKQNDILYTFKGRYTTCDKENPHFSIRAKKIKTIPNKKIITGPAILEFGGVPTPLAIPFGYFPNQKKQSSGIVFPFYGESSNQGFFLRNGGYYFAINDYLDLSIIGDIYTKGSWNIKTNSNYKKKYHYQGNINLSYSSLKSGNDYVGNNIDKRDFFVRWKHQQDQNSNKNRRFSANINAGSSSYQQNNSSSDNDYLSNTFQSNLSYSRNWKSANLAINLRHSQSTLSKEVNLSLPEMNFNLNRFYPLKRFNKTNKSKWYDKLYINYSSNFKNSISIADSLLFQPSTLTKFRNGVVHNIPVSTSFTALKYINISPSFTYKERWYFDRTEKQWFDNKINTDTVNGFYRAFNYSYSLSASTKIYGIINFKNKRIKAIRHISTPSLSLNYSPDFSSENFNFYDEVQIDTLGNIQQYSYYQNGIYGAPGSQSNGSLRFSLGNILEMKTNSEDTINPIKKIKLLEGLNISSSYNLLEDSMQFANINISGRTRLFNKFDITFNSSYDPYQIVNGNRVNKYYLSKTYLPARFVNANASLNFRLNGGVKNDENNIIHWLDYVDFDIPWNLSVNYTMSYNKQSIAQKLNQSLNFSGDLKLTEKWKIGFNSGYDFDAKDLSYTSLNIYRDLHCWEMLVKWIPFGYRQSYNFTIRVKASVLQDLKWEKKKDWYDYQ
ncbi:MAG: hypothetical protein CMP64_00985 [Flavobacteriales bacterium]|nr:hypothetical protein [Flavobacteriales bacterium]